MQLEVQDLHAAYQRDLFVLRGLDLTVAEGDVSIVIGPNGSGKSTLLKSIAGVLKPQRGAVLLNGEDITGIRLDEIIRRGICYIPQERAIFPQMSVTENLEIGCWIFKRNRKLVHERVQWALERFPALKDRKNQLVGSLSGGLQRTLDIAKSLLANPALLLVDEPSVGLAPLVAQSIYAELFALKQEGRTILLVDQDVQSAMEIADWVYVLDLGRVQTRGSREDFAGQLHELVASWLL